MQTAEILDVGLFNCMQIFQACPSQWSQYHSIADGDLSHKGACCAWHTNEICENHKVIGDGSSVGDGLADARKADLNWKL